MREIEVPAEAPEHFGRQLRSFVAALQAGRPSPLGADVGIDALKIIMAIYRSAETGRWIDWSNDRARQRGRDTGNIAKVSVTGGGKTSRCGQ